MNFLFCLIWQLVASREFGRFKAVHHLKAQVVNDEIGVFYQPNFAKNAMDSAKGDGQNWSGNVRFRKRSFHQRPLNFQNNQPNQFDFEDHHLPDHTDPETVLALAQMTYDAYFDTNDSHWVPIPGWNVTTRFGFDSGAIRGYVFEDDLEETLVIVIKGTSLATPIGSGPTAVLDKLNDNMMFSCCCAKASWSWNKICDCPVDGNTCSRSCLRKESNFDGSYYNLAQTIYLAVREWFPKHINIWMTGHSLGGALASLVALTNNIPAFAYESPGDLMFADRLGLLPSGPSADIDAFLSSLPIYHFGNNGDPIYLGECYGPSSSCYWMSYILESHCHVGLECVYDKNGPPVAHVQDININTVQYHSIDYVIKNYLIPAKAVPTCVYKPNCLSTECLTWNFVE